MSLPFISGIGEDLDPALREVTVLEEKSPAQATTDPGEKLDSIRLYHHQELLPTIVEAYDSFLVRMYCKARFLIININILHILTLCLRGKNRVLDVGCGFGLFGCYLSALNPEISYSGYDMNPERVAMARRAASRLGLKNATFHCGDARQLKLDDQFDAIMMVDLMHHIDHPAKQKLVETCRQHLTAQGRLIIKDVTTHPRLKIGFTWALDVLMTRGFKMWYWGEQGFHGLLIRYFDRIDTLPLTDWLPYPHIVYVCENSNQTGQVRESFEI